MANHFKKAFDAVINFAGFGIHQGDFVNGPSQINVRTGTHFLVGSSAVIFKHPGFCEGFGVKRAHRAIGVVKYDMVF